MRCWQVRAHTQIRRPAGAGYDLEGVADTNLYLPAGTLGAKKAIRADVTLFMDSGSVALVGILIQPYFRSRPKCLIWGRDARGFTGISSAVLGVRCRPGTDFPALVEEGGGTTKRVELSPSR